MFTTSFVGTNQANLSYLTANQGGASAGFNAAIATATKPTAGVIFDSLSSYPSLVKIVPMQASSGKLIGVGMRVIGWNSYNNTALWIPTILGEFSLGYTSGSLAAVGTDYYLNSIVSQAGTPSANTYSPATTDAASTSPCSALIDMVGSQLVQIQFKDSANTATFGAYWATL